MTAIIATLEGVWGDRKITSDDGHVCPAVCKLAANHALVAGFAGDFESILRALDAVTAGEEDPRALAAYECDGLVLRAGRLWEIDAGRAWLRPRRTKVLVTGSGWSEVSSFIAGRGKCRDKDVRAALQYVSRKRTDCGGVADFLAAV